METNPGSPESNMPEIMERADGSIVVTVPGGRLVGFMMPDQEGNVEASVQDIEVTSDRQSGKGTLLFTTFTSEAIRQGAYRLWCEAVSPHVLHIIKKLFPPEKIHFTSSTICTISEAIIALNTLVEMSDRHGIPYNERAGVQLYIDLGDPKAPENQPEPAERRPTTERYSDVGPSLLQELYTKLDDQHDVIEEVSGEIMQIQERLRIAQEKITWALMASNAANRDAIIGYISSAVEDAERAERSTLSVLDSITDYKNTT